MILRALGFFFLSLLWACSTPIAVPPLTPDEVSRFDASGNFPDRNYRIEPGDTLQISYTFHQEVNQQALVRPDGRVTLNMVGEVPVSGMSTEQLGQLLVKRTSDRLRSPEVVVGITQYAERTVYIGGEVGKPGMIPYRKSLTPLQAIIAAGGFRDTARADSTILIRAAGPDDKFISRKLDLADAINNAQKELVYLAPHDVIYVPRTAIADANLWVRQHITDLFPFLRGAGASYQLNPGP